MKSNVVILSPNCTYHIGKTIFDYFKEKNIESELIISDKDIIYDDSFIYIIICPVVYKHFPQKYYAYNVEQTTSGRYFFGRYMRKLSNSIGIIDYSLTNISFLKRKFPKKEIYYLPLAFCKNYQNSIKTKTINTPLFYGWVAGRRRPILAKIQSACEIEIIKKMVNERIFDILDKHSIVLNIHHYRKAVLETTRIYESISHGCLVISEDSSDYLEYPELKDIVDFIPSGDVNKMIERIQFWLENPDTLSSRLQHIYDFVKQHNSLKFNETLDILIQKHNLGGK